MRFLDLVFERIRRSAFLYRFALFTRVLLAAGFIPTGLVKLLGHRFTIIPVENPIGAFFEAMYQTGLYWNFLGLCQIVAGILLLIPRWAHLGAALFLPIIVNIFIITVSLPFGGTPLVTGPMVLAVTFLCVWDYHRFRSILTTSPIQLTITEHRLEFWEKVGFTVWSLSLLSVFGILRSSYILDGKLAIVAIGLGLVAGILTLVRFFWLWMTGNFSVGATSVGDLATQSVSKGSQPH